MDFIKLKTAAKIALAALAVLCIGAVVFYKERLFADTSYIAFLIVNYKSFAIQNQRYGSFITQLVPYIGQALHLPLKVILIGYVLSFNLFFFIINALLVYRYRQYGLAILMSLYYFLFVSDSYFLANDEIHQAVAWMFLTFGITIYMGNKRNNIFRVLLPFILFVTLTIFTHFVVIIPTIFIFVYLVTDKKNWPFSIRNTVLLSVILISVIVIKMRFSGGTQSYEKQHLYHLTHLSLQDVIDCFKTPVIRMFLYRCVINYWIAVLVFITGIIYLIRNKKWLLLSWTIISTLGYFALMGVVYGDLDDKVGLFHIETEWQCIGILIASPFVFAFLPKINRKFSTCLLVIIFLTRIVYISSAIPAFSWRIDFTKKTLAEMRKRNVYKAAMYDGILERKYIQDWSLGYESLFESALEGDKPLRTFVLFNKDDKQKETILLSGKTGIFLYDLTDCNRLNKEYFQIDTTQPYQILTNESFLNNYDK